MTLAQRREVKSLIRFYESCHWDWSHAIEFLVRKHNDSLDIQWRYWNVDTTRKPRGRPRKTSPR